MGYISGTKKDDTFDILSGVRQGAVESPVAFNILMDTAVRVSIAELSSEADFGIEFEFSINQESAPPRGEISPPKFGKRKVKVILYADDLVIFASSTACLETVVSKFTEVFGRYGLVVALDKTMTMGFGDLAQPETSSIMRLEDCDIAHVQKFKYLGDTISSDPKFDKIGNKIGSAWQAWNRLRHIFTDHEISLKIRVQILEATVRSVLTYALQASSLTVQESSRIESIWTGFLRKMVKGGYQPRNASTRSGERDWALRYSNAKIREITGTSSIVSFCDKQHLKFIAHTTRRQNDELQKMLCFATPGKGLQSHWRKLSTKTGIDEMQFRRVMFSRDDFKQWIGVQYPK